MDARNHGTSGGSGRPYRSHVRPACLPCKKRKSRCQTEENSQTCLMCRNHRTECLFAENPSIRKYPEQGTRWNRKSQSRSNSDDAGPSTPRRAFAAAGKGHTVSSKPPSRVPTPSICSAAEAANSSTPGHHMTNPSSMASHPSYPSSFHRSVQAGTSYGTMPHDEADENGPLTLGSRDDGQLNLHIVGPAGTNDSHVVSEYLSNIPGSSSGNTRIVIPGSVSRSRQSRPVLFTMVEKRPVGVTMNSSPSAEKLEIIEKLIEPHTEALMNEYFQRVNPCAPLLDEVFFRRQYIEDKSRISPALLACLYAHTIVYWQSSRVLSKQRCPDARYIWNLANEAVYSELRLSPGLSTIEAILLDTGGRPTTSLIGNGVLLGSAVSMAHSLGLNHDPLSWDIPQSEKLVRLRIWWSLLIQDRWTSLANGTPPHLSKTQFDVPAPSLKYLGDNGAVSANAMTFSIFIALYGLTDVLSQHLEHIYSVGDKMYATTDLEFALNDWVESLSGHTRQIIIRGNRLDNPGAANLRLAYLTTRLLQQRIHLESDKQRYEPGDQRIHLRYTHAKQTSEEILMLVQELHTQNLGDFWSSSSAFAFPATVSFLLRCALETNSSPDLVVQSGSFKIARDLISTLRSHQENYGWELGDLCLAQYSEIIDKIQAGVVRDQQGAGLGGMDVGDLAMPDTSLIDQLFPSVWDPLQVSW